MLQFDAPIYEIVIFLGVVSGADFGNDTAKTPFSRDALISSSFTP